MKNLLLTLLILSGLVLQGKTQELVGTSEGLVFSTDAEKALWTEGESNLFQLFRAVQAKPEFSSDSWVDLVEELDSKAQKSGDQLALLRQIFQKTHQKLLKKYEQHSTFNAMLSAGKYDCVSGSAALGLLLERYGFEFDIVETDYHVFLVVNLEGKKIVLESTLPVGGMITTPTEVQNYLNAYQPEKNAQRYNLNQTIAGPVVDYSDNSTFRIVTLKELAGLQYYNDAIVHFNKQAYGKAVDQLSKAYLLYPSDRIDGLRDLSIDLAYKSYGYDLRK
ncbi:hypothetical protein [Algoriphagus taiwanensis]|uniref:Protein SirB1 N-terminal domain-containing protein n=1 Tax=Algoriphagus taiwanensis TaxID=1445656 RepID=A0ABQ6Q3S6_9BACT|nr:hypothetical protein Ataiwa_24050 [Algoriphagus taiwanensis]